MRIGQVDTATDTIKQWGNNNTAVQYDYGLNPTVAFTLSSGVEALVEVHNGGTEWLLFGPTLATSLDRALSNG
jgi:hypothetical protein